MIANQTQLLQPLLLDVAIGELFQSVGTQIESLQLEKTITVAKVKFINVVAAQVDVAKAGHFVEIMHWEVLEHITTQIDADEVDALKAVDPMAVVDRENGQHWFRRDADCRFFRLQIILSQ